MKFNRTVVAILMGLIGLTVLFRPGLALAQGPVDLALDKTVDVTGPAEGDTVVYTVTLANTDPVSTATGIVVSDPMPAGVTFIDGTATAGLYDPLTGLWTLGADLLPEGAATLTMTVEVDPATAGQTITNTAQINPFDQEDPNPANNLAEAVFTVAEPPAVEVDLALDKTVDVTNPAEGDTVIFTLTLTNTSLTDPATGVVISDPLPLGIALIDAVATTGNYDIFSGQWTLDADLPAEGTATLTLTAEVNPATAGQTITNTAQIQTADQKDPNAANDLAEAVFTVAEPPAASIDLALAKTVDTAGPAEGDTVIYTVTVTNTSLADPATGVVIGDLLPPEVALLDAAATAGSYNPATGLWTLGVDLPAEGTATLTVTAAVNLGTAGQIVTNTAEISVAGQPDPNPANNLAEAVFTVAGATPGIDLSLAKTVDIAGPAEGDTVVYAITVENTDPVEAATGVVVSDTLPLSVTLVTSATTAGSYDPLTGLWTVDSAIAPGDIVTLTVTVEVSPAIVGDTVTNTAEINAVDQADPNPFNNLAEAAFTVTEPGSGADLVVSKTAEPDVVAAGEVLTYTITISNNGPATATTVLVSDTLPAGAAFVSVSPGAPDCAESGGVITCTLASLANGEMATVTLLVTTATTGTLTNTVTVESLEPDPIPFNNSATVETLVTIGVSPEILYYLPMIFKDGVLTEGSD